MTKPTAALTSPQSSSAQSSSAQSSILRSLFTSLVSTISVAAAVGSFAIAATANPVSPVNPSTNPSTHAIASATSAPVTSLPDGTYLYGESDQPDQPHHTYFVFEVKQGAVMGALYAPNSSFDCTQGKFESQQLALSVVDTYAKTVSPLALAATYSGTVAGFNPVTELGLEGMKRVQGEISDRDRQILATCKAYFTNSKKASLSR